MLFYTGLDVQRFNWLCGQCTKFPIKTRLLLADDHLLAVLMRLRRSFTIKDLAYRFNVREATMSKVFRSWIKILSKKLVKLIKWPSKHALILQLPKCFRNYRKCVAIIDEECATRGATLEIPAFTKGKNQFLNLKLTSHGKLLT